MMEKDTPEPQHLYLTLADEIDDLTMAVLTDA